MVSSMNDAKRLQKRPVENNLVVEIPDRRRVSKKKTSEKKGEGTNMSVDLPTGSAQRKLPGTRQSGAANRKKKTTSLSPAIVDVVFGKVQNSVVDVEELRKKREEDVARCGRIMKTVGTTSPVFPLQKSKITDLANTSLQKELTETLHSKS